MEVIFLHEHTDKLVAQDKGNNHPGYRNHHVITHIADHEENPGVPCRRGRPHVCRNFPDFAVDLVKHTVQVAHDAVPEDTLDPVCDYVEDVQHWLRPLSRTGSPAGG